MRAPHQFVLAFALAAALAGTTQAENWPKGYIVARKSESPDGRYGILIESRESALNEMNAAEEAQHTPDAAETASQTPDNNDAATVVGADEDEDYVNYVADLKSHEIIGKIKGSDYFQGQNHRGFVAKWSADSKLCVAEYDGRFGVDSIKILQPAGDHSNQVDIGEKVQKTSDAATKKPDVEVDVQPYFRFEAGGKIRVRAVGQNNPKQLEDVKTYYVFFRGIYDYSARKWTAAEARAINADLSDQLESALPDEPEKGIFVGAQAPDDFTGTIVASEDEKAELMDKTLNQVYQALHGVLPAAQFAKIKTDEKEWVKKLEASKSAVEKSELLTARIKILQDLLWQ